MAEEEKEPEKQAGLLEAGQQSEEEVEEPVAESAKPETAPSRRRRRAAEPVAEVSEQEPASPLSVGLFNAAGQRNGDAQLPESIFGAQPNPAVMHQAYLRQLANSRQGTASTKTRTDVAGGGAKPHRQKGTGRARHGSDREPSMVGGGTVFGPHPRSYAQRMPRKMRRLALRSALTVKAAERRVTVLDGFDIEAPRTRAVVDLLRSVGVEDTALLVLAAPNQVVARSIANVPWAKAILASNLNLYDIFTHKHLVITKDALGLIEETYSA